MVLTRIRDLIWSSSSSSPSSSSSSSSSTSELLPTRDSGLLPPRDYDLGLGFPNKNNNLRLSSSLQDLSTYQKLNQFHNSLYTSHQQSFSKEKVSPLPPGSPYSARKKCLRVLFLFLCLLLLAFIVYLFVLFISSYWSQGSSKFYVVLDCGSTGTRVYVYQASLYQHSQRTIPIVIKSLNPEKSLHRKPSSQSGRAYHRMETEPGLHKLVHNISGLKSAIKPLVRWAAKQIPRHAHETTSVFLYATAGVRRLPSADSKWLLDNAWSILNSSPFLCRREWVKIISGMEEAYFGWIALNHLKGMLGAKPRTPTFGALDLGGSSLQVTFESEPHDQSETNLNLRIGNVNHHLTAYSLPGYGLNDAFDKSVVHLFKRLPENIKAELLSGKVQIKHPCLQTGYKEQYTCSQCSKYQQGKSLDVGGKLGSRVTLIGAPNWDECSALAKFAVNLSEWSNVSSGINCDLQPCALGDGFPRPSGQFYALSGFYVVYRFFNLSSDAALDNVLEKGREFCERTWETAKNSVAPQPFIEQYCFRAPYIVSLLREGLHIKDSKITIGSGSITWTLGVALLEAGNAFSSRMGIRNYYIFQMEINPFLLLIVLFISLFLLLCVLSCAGNWRPKFLRRSYLPLFRHNNASSVSVLGMTSPFRLQRWSPISSGDGRAKTPLSPTIGSTQQRAFGFGAGIGSNGEIQLMESSLYPSSTSSVAHSYSSTNLGQMQFDNGSTGSFWSPHRSQMRLQSRRSQSREDLSSSIAEAHMVKV
ncbi:hypothetical protein G4B88_026611 [Cannabis sativa]|uniref:Apyrase 7 n=1 Tax=Cannabis sativa TaxID=3483 RepID=A0A7J6GRD4_CANSA|nr:hypothetical protein G4B88_026611 [Cannabis sativa]